MVSSENKVNTETKGRHLAGIVVSNKMQKTIVVKVERTYRHSLYNKVIRSRKNYMVHDENGSAKVGDSVLVRECAPYSKNKHMVLVEVVNN